MKKNRKPESFIKSPEYPGGPKALKAFILKELKYPQEALENKTEGTVRMRLFIDKKSGGVNEVKVISGVADGCTEEAIRIAKLLRFNTDPPKGMRINYQKVINIPFRLPKHVGMQYAYSVKQEKQAEEKQDTEGKPNTYGYTIRW